MSRLTWCPPEYRAAYDALTRKKIKAAEAREMIEQQMARDAARPRPPEPAPPPAAPKAPRVPVAEEPRRVVGTPPPRIGDIVHLPGSYDPTLVQIALNRRKKWARAHQATGPGNHMLKVARLVIAANAESQRRASDPVERAKSYLQRRGYAVFAADVADPSQRGFVVGRRTVPDGDALIDLARKLGWAA